MNRWTFVALVSMGMIPTIGCAGDFGAPEDEALGEAEAAIGLPTLCQGEDPPPELCGWKNGWDGWFNGFANDRETGWRAPWRNGWEHYGSQLGHSNGWVLGWSQKWGAAWGDWNFAPGFAWALWGGNGCSKPISRVSPTGMTEGCRLNNPLVAAVCATSGYEMCCQPKIPPKYLVNPYHWDQSCVDLALDLADNVGAKHSIFETGGPLSPTWSPIFDTGGGIVVAQPLAPTTGPAATSTATVAATPRANLAFGPIVKFPFQTNACIKAVCDAADTASCCTTAWTSFCVATAVNKCTARYTTRTRWDETDKRVYADACVEPKLGGVPTCPLNYTMTEGKECCRRTLVLRGVYYAEDGSNGGLGRKVLWKLREAFETWRAQATLVPDPCMDLAGSDGPEGPLTQRVCDTENRHKLWQAAGPHGTVYPDCRSIPYPSADPQWEPTGDPRDCDYWDTQGNVAERVTDGTHNLVGYRAVLVAAMAALITTNGSYNIDIQWDQGSLAPLGAPMWGLATPREARWRTATAPYTDGDGQSWSTWSEAACFFQGAQNRIGASVAGLPKCEDMAPAGWPQVNITSFYGYPVLSPN